VKKLAVYPGSFDPITNGHMDIIRRSLHMFDELIVLIAYNPTKKTNFSLEERLEMIREVTKECKNLSVDSYDGLLVDYLREKSADVIIRGLRALSDDWVPVVLYKFHHHQRGGKHGRVSRGAGSGHCQRKTDRKIF